MPIQSDLRRSKERSLKSGELGAEPPALASESPSGGPRVIGSQLRRNDPFPTLQIVLIPLGNITDACRRVRRASKSQVLAVKRSMERFGNRVPILVRGKDAAGTHEAIDGHSRLAAARLLGADTMPCLVVDDLPETEIRRLALSLNRLQERGEWSPEELRLEVEELIALDDDFDLPGFEIAEIEALILGDEAETEDPADDLTGLSMTGPAVSRSGDLWVLGEHRVLCGSARDPSALERLAAGRPVDAVWTDPPYNVRVNGHVRSRDKGFAEFAEGSGEMSRNAFVAFLTETLGLSTAHLKPGGMLYACMDWRHVAEMSEAISAIGLTLLNVCIWVKTHPGQGSLYRSQHELVFVARKPGARHRNNIELGVHGRNRSNVWTYAGATGGKADGDDNFAVHPTVKPIRMIRDALLDVTIPRERVLDPFLGSGSTLLAADRARRCCIGVEIEPAYVDLVVRRWQEMTGGTAMHAENGATFDTMALSRAKDANSEVIREGEELPARSPAPPDSGEAV